MIDQWPPKICYLLVTCLVVNNMTIQSLGSYVYTTIDVIGH
jgi:hypothetical protein